MPALYFQGSQGERVGNIAFGYRLTGDGQHFEPDPPEQVALAEIPAAAPNARPCAAPPLP